MEFECYQRNDRIIRTTICYNDEPLKLDGCEVLFTVSTGSLCVFSKSINNGIQIIDQVNGVVEININSNDTDRIPGIYKYELLITDVEGNRLTTAQGRFTINKSYAKECLDE